MPRREDRRLHAVPDLTTPAATQRRSRRPDPNLALFAEDEIAGDDVASLGLATLDAAELAAMPMGAIIEQLEALGMPAELVAESRDLGDEHRAELAAMLGAATAILTGDPVAGVLSLWEPLLDKKITAIDAEMAAAELIWSLAGAPEGTDDDDDGFDLVDSLTRLIEVTEHSGRPEALVMCRMLAHLGPPEVRSQAARAANTLATGGVRDRPWVSALGTATFERAYGFSDGPARLLAVDFAYGRRAHAFVFLIDETRGGGRRRSRTAARRPVLAALYATDDVDELFHDVRIDAMSQGLALTDVAAADAATIIRSALESPPRPHDDEAREEMEWLLPIVRERLLRMPAADSPPARAASSGPAEVYQPPRDVSAVDFGPPPRARAKVVHRIKVSLAGFKPPVWRRLEIPSDMNLLTLHHVLQMSFGWNDTHLWQFTARGEIFAIGEVGRPHRDARKATLGEIAARKGALIEYMYDLGDQWVHRIRVENVGPGDPDLGYPRCVAGNQAGPAGYPDESGDDQPDPFDVEELNDRLERHIWRRRR